MSIEDPYFVVRDEVNQAVRACATKLKEWQRVMQVKLLYLSTVGVTKLR